MCLTKLYQISNFLFYLSSIAAGICMGLIMKFNFDIVWAAWLCGAIGVSALIVGSISWVKLTRTFVDIFHFEPPDREQKGFKARNVSMWHVDQELTIRAEAFKKACHAEDKINLEKFNSGKDAIKAIQIATEEVKRLKNAFWRAHNIAKFYKYPTKKGFRDYLPQSKEVGMSSEA